MEPGVWLIAGPTASGKSAAALTLAERAGGEIVNADALQLYADLRILTARPTAEEEARAPHHLYGIADAAEAWSVGRWLRAVLPVLAAIRARGRPALVVGGTGLYFRALTQGLADIPPVPEELRSKVQARFEAEGEALLRAALSEVDSEAEARIAPGDRQRLVRALAVAQVTGKPLSAWRRETRAPLAPADWRGVVIAPPRPTLYARCDARLLAMVEAGALTEIAAVEARGLDARLPALKALGLRELSAALRGEMATLEAVVAAQQQTRRFAKRQLTWFRNQTPDWPTIDAGAPGAAKALAATFVRPAGA